MEVLEVKCTFTALHLSKRDEAYEVTGTWKPLLPGSRTLLPLYFVQVFVYRLILEQLLSKAKKGEPIACDGMPEWPMFLSKILQNNDSVLTINTHIKAVIIQIDFGMMANGAPKHFAIIDVVDDEDLTATIEAMYVSPAATSNTMLDDEHPE